MILHGIVHSPDRLPATPEPGGKGTMGMIRM